MEGFITDIGIFFYGTVFSLAFFSVAGCHAVNLGHYAVLQAATLSFEQHGG